MYGYVGNDPLGYTDPYGLDFLGKCIALQYLQQYGADAWSHIRSDRDSTKPVIVGGKSEEMRNAEHYLYSYQNVMNNSYKWGVMHGLTVGYNTVKFWANVAEYWGEDFGVDSPFTYSPPTNDELKSGFEGSNDALFGMSDDKCECKK